MLISSMPERIQNSRIQNSRIQGSKRHEELSFI
jgi:hypothetical protein